MSKNKKIVWSEGMFLVPHHFQRWDQYHETLLSERLAAINPFGWGLISFDVDPDGLANGNFAVLKCSAVMPDGLVVSIPDRDSSPEIRQVDSHFPPSLEHLDVYLGIPAEKGDSANCRLTDSDGSRSMRFATEFVKVPDFNTGENTREITVARKNFKVFFSGEDPTDYTSIKIAELVRTPGGSIALREPYIAPSLMVSASPYLMRLIKGLLEIMTAKSSSLTGEKRAMNESGKGNMARFALLHTVNAFIPILLHMSHQGKVHPEALYLALVRFAGELSTFSMDIHPRDFPQYQHANLSNTFSELDKKIRSMLEGVTPSRHVVVSLEILRENVLVGKVEDDRLLQSADFYLAVSGEMAEEKVREMIPRRIKVGASTDLDLIITTAMPGVRLYHTPRPPTSLPMKQGCQYFRLENKGDYWDSILRSRTISLYIPTDLKSLTYELLGVKE